MNRQRQEQLIAAFLAGVANETELLELKQAVQQDPQIAQRLSEMLMLDHMLHHIHDDGDGSLMGKEVCTVLRNEHSGRHFAKKTIEKIRDQQKPSGTRSITRSHRRRRKKQQSFDVMWLAVGAAAALLIALILWPQAQPVVEPVQEPEIAEVPQQQTIASVGQWSNIRGQDLLRADGADQRSSRCMIGDRLTASADCELNLDDKSVLTIKKGARVRIAGSPVNPVFVLEEGSLHAQISKQKLGSSMVFKTQHGSSRIVGTEFLLKNVGYKSRLEVYEGRIEQTNASSNDSVFVDAGQYVYIAPNKKMHVKPLKGTPQTQVKEPEIETEEPDRELPEPEVVQHSKPALYEWQIAHPLKKYWQQGAYSATACAVQAMWQNNAYGVMARLDCRRSRPDQQFANDELHIQIRADEATDVHVSLYLADKNKSTKPSEQYIRLTIPITKVSTWQNHKIPLHTFQTRMKDLLSNNHGCFALRITSQTSFELKHASLHRP